MGVQPPLLVFLTLLGVKGYSLAVPQRHFGHDPPKIDRDILALPETIVESYEIKAANILRSSFDFVWNACGFERCLDYDEAGEYKPNTR